MKNYDIIYSIGRDCACSEYLRRHKLRICSGPFDWLTNAGFKERFTYLLNDFDNFLNEEDFYLLEKDPNLSNDNHCDYYENRRTSFYFYHDFPAGKDFSDTFKNVKEKYSRRIHRFYENIKSKDRVLLVWLSHYHDTPNDEVEKLCNEFIEKMGKPIDFLIIEHVENADINFIEKTPISKNIVKFRTNSITLDDQGNITTLGNERNCNAIFSDYKLNIPLLTVFKRLLITVVVKLVCLFIPTKAKRREIRKAFVKW